MFYENQEGEAPSESYLSCECTGCELRVRGEAGRANPDSQGDHRRLVPLTWLLFARASGNPTHCKTLDDAVRMVTRRLLRAGIPPVFSNHSFLATGITELLANGGSLEIAQQVANHADGRTTKLYDRRATRLELEEIVRIRY